MRHPTAVRRLSGFTLIELLIVISIMGILMTMSIGRFSTMTSKVRLERAAQTLSYDLRFAFALVGRNRTPVLVKWDATKTQFNITDRNATTTYFRSRPLGITSAFSLSSATVTIYPTAGVTIFPPGLASDSMHILLKDSYGSRVVSVNRAGLTRVLTLSQ